MTRADDLRLALDLLRANFDAEGLAVSDQRRPAAATEYIIDVVEVIGEAVAQLLEYAQPRVVVVDDAQSRAQ